jgi:hypothetical protein
MKLHLQCRTQEEIGEAVGMTQQAVDKVLQQIANLQKVVNPSELYPPLALASASPPKRNFWQSCRTLHVTMQ